MTAYRPFSLRFVTDSISITGTFSNHELELESLSANYVACTLKERLHADRPLRELARSPHVPQSFPFAPRSQSFPFTPRSSLISLKISTLLEACKLLFTVKK